MDYGKFMKEVRERGGFASMDHAERATRATLSLLGERLAGGQPGNLAAQLPAELADALGAEGPGESFGVGVLPPRRRARGIRLHTRTGPRARDGRHVDRRRRCHGR